MAPELPVIVVIDDENDITEFLSYNLTKEGFTVFTANDSQAGIELVRRVKPALVLLDIMMPQLDGIEVCRMMRAEEETKHILVAFLTARDEDFTQISALDVGGDDYITKPVKPRIILSRIRALLRRERGVDTITDPVIKFGDMEINRENLSVHVKDQRVELARKEIEILLLLATKPGKVFTRDEIFNTIWGEDVIVGTRTIDVHIRKLREKIGEDYIRTFKGIGYKLDF
jgi:two-component system, OmpR family, alkaline phosphatase synthesis response regulator PhoP